MLNLQLVSQAKVEVFKAEPGPYGTAKHAGKIWLSLEENRRLTMIFGLNDIS
jgi:hypothetical protein